jgi:hypothetical protein
MHLISHHHSPSLTFEVVAGEEVVELRELVDLMGGLVVKGDFLAVEGVEVEQAETLPQLGLEVLVVLAGRVQLKFFFIDKQNES